MSVEYGFYNSVNGDRKYSARAFARIFNGVINDGIYGAVGDKFMVKPNTNDSTKLSVIVGTGQAWFLSTWTFNNAAISLDLESANLAYGRIDAIILKVDTLERTNSITVKVGTPAPEPSRPALTKNQSVGEYALAYVTVPAGATQITTANIQNVMGGETPLVTGVLEVLNAKDVFTNWEKQVADMQSAYKSSFENMLTTYGGTNGKFPNMESTYTKKFNAIESTYADTSTGKFPVLERTYAEKFNTALSEFNTDKSACIDAFNLDQNSRKTAFAQEQSDRSTTFQESEDSRSSTFDSSQSSKADTFEEAMKNWEKRVADLVGGRFPEKSVITATLADGAVTKVKLGDDVLYAVSDTAGGAATSANKLNTDAGSAKQPVYFHNGIPVATTYTLEKSVPSDAKFTDTTYTLKSFDITVPAAKINYLADVTSSVQGQLDGKIAKSGGTMTGAITLKGIYLTEGEDYGSSLPSSAPKGKLFLKKI